jgi:hypothetical protein
MALSRLGRIAASSMTGFTIQQDSFAAMKWKATQHVFRPIPDSGLVCEKSAIVESAISEMHMDCRKKKA